MTPEPRWLPPTAIRAIHNELIAEHGGKPGILNPNALDSTLAKPKNLYAYGDRPTLSQLAAAYGYGFAKNHCFVDGNKRIALAAIDVFLRINGYYLVADELDAVTTILNLVTTPAPAAQAQQDLAQWIEDNSDKLE